MNIIRPRILLYHYYCYQTWHFALSLILSTSHDKRSMLKLCSVLRQLIDFKLYHSVDFTCYWIPKTLKPCMGVFRVLEEAREFFSSDSRYAGRPAAACAVRAVYLVAGLVYHNTSGLHRCKQTARLQAFDKHLRSVSAHQRR
jgi:hypothetical protein